MAQVGQILLRSSDTEDMTPDRGLVLGRALAVENRRVMVARDRMRTSPMMAEAVISGLLSQGADVVDAGVLSMPAASMHASGADCTVYVAGRPGKVSGYFLMNRDGTLFRDEQIRHLDIVSQSVPDPPDHKGIGKYTRRGGLTESYNRVVGQTLARGMKCSVVVDCRCGTSSDSVPQLLNAAGAEVVALNGQVDPEFRYTNETLGDEEASIAEKIVSMSLGSIGVRMNGMGTLAEIIDETGNPLSADEVFALLVLYLRPATVAVSADSTTLIEDAFKGRLEAEIDSPHEPPDPSAMKFVVTRENASDVCKAVADGADLGYYHGSIVFKGGAMVGDGIRVAVTIAQMAADNSLHRTRESFGEYFREVAEFDVPYEESVFRRVFEEVLDVYGERCSRFNDTYRVDLDGGWFMFQYASREDGGTVKATAESDDLAYVLGLKEVALKAVEDALRLSQRSVYHFELEGLPPGVVGLPAGPVVRLAGDEVHPAAVGEELLVGLRRAVGVPGVRVRGPGEAVVYGRHPAVDEAVGLPVDRPGQQHHLRDHAVDLPDHADELVRERGPRGLVERVDEVDVHRPHPVHSVFTSLSLTRE